MAVHITAMGHFEIDTYYRTASARARFLSSRDRPTLMRLAAFLAHRGYRQARARSLLSCALHLAAWTERRGRSLSTLSRQDVARFVVHALRCRCFPRGQTPGRRSTTATARAVWGFLQTGRPTALAWTVRPAEPPVVKAFRRWLKAHRGLADNTITQYAERARAMIAKLGEDVAAYTMSLVHRYVVRSWAGRGAATVSFSAKVLRHLLRFLAATDRCRLDLSRAVPRLRSVRPMASPFVLPPADIRKVIAGARGARARLRDRAVLLLLFRLGLRASDVRQLKIADIDWEQALLRVSGKNRREELLPLPQVVGDAILAYLTRERPATRSPYVFLLSRAGFDGFGRSTVSGIRRLALERAGVRIPSTGAHLARHTCATALLRRRVPLGAVQRLLRHARVTTTSTYCGVDQAHLGMAIVPWPT